jgi:hypothetical protein
MTHSTQVVDLSWANIGNYSNKVSGITKITVVKEQFDTSVMSVFVDVIDTSSIKSGRTTDDSMNLCFINELVRFVSFS